jgi:hypothetical protein
MVTVNLLNISTGEYSFGPSATLLSITPQDRTSIPANSASELTVPTHNLQRNSGLFSYLSWHTQVSTFAGREKELAELHAWAEDTPLISIKFVTAEGGAGKSRLAAQFCRELQRQGWAAGFIKLRDAAAFPLSSKGTLIVVDYPEEQRSAVKDILQGLSNSGESHRIRVLFLTRTDILDWDELIGAGKARNLVDQKPIVLGPLQPEAAQSIYHSTQEQVAKDRDTTPLPISVDDMGQWINAQPENKLPLFIMAAAVHSAIRPEDNFEHYSGPDVVDALIQRELDRVCSISESLGADRYGLARLLCLATLGQDLSWAVVYNWDIPTRELVGIPEGWKAKEDLIASGYLAEGAFQTIRPDIVAAGFLDTVLSKENEKAPELMCLGARLNPEQCSEVLSRLVYDAENVLARPNRLCTWLVTALENKPDFCLILQSFAGKKLAHNIAKIGIVVARSLTNYAKTEEEKAAIFNNLSN